MWSPAGAKSTNTRLPLFGLLVGLYWHHCTTNHHIVSHLSLRNIPPKVLAANCLVRRMGGLGCGLLHVHMCTKRCPAPQQGERRSRSTVRRCRDSDTLSRYNWGADSNETGEQNLILKAGYVGMGSRFHNYAKQISYIPLN